MQVSDAVLLSTMVDGVVLVVDSREHVLALRLCQGQDFGGGAEPDEQAKR
jgi:hypothetical protein